MTKQEVKDEWRQNEGNPEIKLANTRARFGRQRSYLRRRMMADVPKASAVICQSTHFAVALLYEHTAMAAPKVVAKGKIFSCFAYSRSSAGASGPDYENPPLAQALYKNCEVGREIPGGVFIRPSRKF